MISKKVILVGSFGVGKTSLFNQFLYSKFSEKYLTTIGVKVDKKVVEVDGRELSMLIWDIAGEVTQDKVPHTYFLGASGIIYVFDLTRPSTYKNIGIDMKYLSDKMPGIAMQVVGNKVDLVDEAGLDVVREAIEVPWDLLSSAKTGENVEDLFQRMGELLLTE